MNCERVSCEEIADKYVSGQLDSPLRDEFEIHILGCRKCLELVGAYEGLRSELAARADEIRVTPERKFFRFRLVWVPAAAILVVVAYSLVGVRFGRRGPSQQAA